MWDNPERVVAWFGRNAVGDLCKRCSVEAVTRHRFYGTPHFRPQAGHYTPLRAAFAEVSVGVDGLS